MVRRSFYIYCIRCASRDIHGYPLIPTGTQRNAHAYPVTWQHKRYRVGANCKRTTLLGEQVRGPKLLHLQRYAMRIALVSRDGEA